MREVRLMENIAIIPARSGSKGLKDKNIRLLTGKPLMAYSIESARDSGCFSEIMVSTDSAEYQRIAVEYGANVPFLRSSETSTDTAGSWDVVREVLDGYAKMGRRFDSVCLLQPTSPLRTAEDIKLAYEKYSENNADAVTSVCEAEHSPLWCMTLPENQSLKEFREQSRGNAPRQKLAQYYRLNGAVFIRRIKYDGGKSIICDAEEFAYIMDKRRSVDIDTIEDFEYAEFLTGGAYAHNN
jgi:CMP-N,N'-diacetyllegionaminic acid synthase